MFCETCGKQLPDNSTFCDNCGAALNSYTQPSYTQQPVQPSYPQPVQQPVYQQPGYGYQAPVMSVGQYVGIFFLSAIPLVGVILMLVWAFGGDVNPNKKNYARASLLVAVIMIAISIVLSIIAYVSFAALIQNIPTYPAYRYF